MGKIEQTTVFNNDLKFLGQKINLPMGIHTVIKLNKPVTCKLSGESKKVSVDKVCVATALDFTGGTGGAHYIGQFGETVIFCVNEKNEPDFSNTLGEPFEAWPSDNHYCEGFQTHMRVCSEIANRF